MYPHSPRAACTWPTLWTSAHTVCRESAMPQSVPSSSGASDAGHRRDQVAAQDGPASPAQKWERHKSHHRFSTSEMRLARLVGLQAQGAAGGSSWQPAASVRQSAVSLKVVSKPRVRVRTAPMISTAINATMSPYSTAVAPSCSCSLFRSLLIDLPLCVVLARSPRETSVSGDAQSTSIGPWWRTSRDRSPKAVLSLTAPLRRAAD